MKKIISIILICLLLTGCMKVNSKSAIDSVLEEGLSPKKNLVNQYKDGYKYYLPRGMQVSVKQDYNETLKSDKYAYYLYVDVISYYQKYSEDYIINSNAFYSKSLEHNKNKGYLEINKINNYFFVEMMYNYAKIEVMVEEDDINKVILNSATILSSIKYNDDIIKNFVGENVLEFNEKTYDIYKPKQNDNNYLEIMEEYNTYEEEIPDYDKVN